MNEQLQEAAESIEAVVNQVELFDKAITSYLKPETPEELFSDSLFDIANRLLQVSNNLKDVVKKTE